MKVLAALLAAVAILGAGAALWLFEPRAGDEDEIDAADLSEEFSGSACRRMAGVADKLAERDQDEADFLRAFGLRAAGIGGPRAPTATWRGAGAT